MRRVLVPLDGSKNAEAALPLLEQICSPGDTVVLLSVRKPERPERSATVPGQPVGGAVSGPSGAVLGLVTPDVSVFRETTDQTLDRQTNEARDYLEGLAGGLRQAGLEVETTVIVDDQPGNAIVAYAKKMKPSFIAMLRRTRFGVSELLFGSVATHLVESKVAPVLFVPAG